MTEILEEPIILVADDEPEALAHLTAQPWPGEVRQLQNVLARGAILTRGQIISDGLHQ